MAYRFEADDASVLAGIRRIAREQIDGGIRAIDHSGDDRNAVIHDLRTSCKKLRGVVRLVRPVFDGYTDENAAFRDAARALSGARDAEVLRRTYDLLVRTFHSRIDRPALSTVRRRLTLRRRESLRGEDIDERLVAFRSAMVEARARCRAARLLSPIWREPMKARRTLAHDLGDLLGEHHDLAEFCRILRADPEAFGAPKDVEVLRGLAWTRQAELETRAFPLGERLLAEPAKALVGRWATYWDLWREEAAAHAPASCHVA